MDEDSVNIEKNKRTLEEIRRLRDNGGRNINGPGGGSNAGSGEGVNSQAPRVDTGTTQRVDSRDDRDSQRTGEIDNPPQGVRRRVRPPDGSGVNPPKGPVNVGGTSGEDNNVPESVKKPLFVLKNPFPKQEPKSVKLFTKEEAAREYPKLYDVYMRGSGLLDDILEIIVKGHEPVEIWQLSEDEAEMLVTMHLERAQYDEQAARSARKLIEIYDRLYMYLLVYPRARMTIVHVKAQGGFSFR